MTNQFNLIFAVVGSSQHVLAHSLLARCEWAFLLESEYPRSTELMVRRSMSGRSLSPKGCDKASHNDLSLTGGQGLNPCSDSFIRTKCHARQTYVVNAGGDTRDPQSVSDTCPTHAPSRQGANERDREGMIARVGGWSQLF